MRHCRALLVAALYCVGQPAFAQESRVPAPAPAVDAITAVDTATSGTEGVAQAAASAPVDSAAQVLVVPPPQPPGTVPSISSLFTGLGRDIRHTATTTHAVIMLTAGASGALIHPYDYRLTDTFSSSPALETFLGPGQFVGGFAVQFGGAWAAYGIGRAIRSERTAVVGADLVRAQLVNMVFTQGLKLTVNRTRPDGNAWSFPSGHSSGTFANAAVLHRHFGWKVGAPAYAVATYVAASRLQARRHFASDVIVGAGIGIISGRAVTVGRGANRFSVSPMGVRGGAGVTFTRVGN